MKKSTLVIALLILCVVIAVVPLATIKNPGGETESLLFCLQGAFGALIIGYGFGYFVARKKYNK